MSAAREVDSEAATTAMPVPPSENAQPSASVPWGAPAGTPEPTSWPADPPATSLLADPPGTSSLADPPPASSPTGSLTEAGLPRMEPSPDGLLPDESPPTGLSDAELAAEHQLIARRFPDGVPESTTVLPAIPAASITPEPAAAPSRNAGTAQHHPVAVTCPDCGASSMVELTRRDALDFCQRCDFPLFWARDQVVIGEPIDSNDDALRRLPGTLGRVVIASAPCPHCNEPNLPTATLCVRCGLSLQASAPPAPPQPRPMVPEPPMEPLEDEQHRWWIWLLVLLTLLLVAGIVLLAAQPWN